MNSVGFLELFLAMAIAVFGGAHAAFKVKRPESVGVIDVAVWFIAIFFGVGPCVAAFSGGMLMEHGATTVFLAYLGIGLFIVGLLLGGQLIGLFVQRRHPLEPGEDRRGLAPIMALVGDVNVPLLMAFYAVGILVKVYVGVQYRVFFSGDTESKLIPMPYAVRSALDLSALVLDATFLWASVMFCARGRHRHLALVVIVVGLLLSFTVGRRWLIADVFLLSLSYYMYRGLSVRVFMVSIFLAAVLVFAAMPFFWRVRYYRQMETADTNAIRTILTASIHTITDWDNEQLREAYRGNLASRPFFIRFNMSIIDGQESQSYMMGRTLKRTLLWTVPSFLYADKALMIDPEQEIEEFYGMPLEDTSSNWPAYGQADLGLVGTFLAGVIFSLIIGTVEVVAARVGGRFPLVGVLATAGMLGCAMAVEETPINLLHSVRDVIIVAIPIIIATQFFGRPRNVTHGQGSWSTGYGTEGESLT